MLNNKQLNGWLGKDRQVETKNIAFKQVVEEKKERLIRNPLSEVDYGYSFPGLDVLKIACLTEVRSLFSQTGNRPVVADIGAGFGTMTWKLLSAGATVDAFEIQIPTAKELSKRVHAMDESLWEDATLDDILRVHPGNALELLDDPSFKDKFDVIWMSQVVHFMTPDEIKTLNALFKNILKPGGKVFIMANSVHQFKHMDTHNVIGQAFDEAKSNEAFCPGFMTVNSATLINDTFGKVVGVSMVSAYNLTQMSHNAIPIKINAYGMGYLGPTDEKKKLPELEQIKSQAPCFTYRINRFHQVMNLFEPETAKLCFAQSGFAVKSFNYDALTHTKPLSSDTTKTVATIVLLQKSPDVSSSPSSNLKQLSNLFEPAVKDKLAFCMSKITNVQFKKSLQSAIDKKDFSLLLRRACSRAELPLVKVLLKHKEELKLEINQASSNGNTALDWLAAVNKESQEKTRVSELLIKHGAKSSADMLSPEQKFS